MTVRSFLATDLVSLPRLTATTAAILLQQLLTAAKAEATLPTALAAYRDELATTQAPLEGELKKRVFANAAPTDAILQADRVEDAAWTGLYHWLHGWSRLPAELDESASATKILDALYPEGLKFLQLSPPLEWREAESRMGLLTDYGYDAMITKMGGTTLLNNLKTAHKGYGETLGMTVIKAAVDPPALRAARDAATDAIRTYVLRVSASVLRSDPTTAELAERLLAPLANWKDPKGALATADPGEADGTDGTATATPAGTATSAASTTTAAPTTGTTTAAPTHAAPTTGTATSH